MPSIPLSIIVQTLSREGARCAFLFVSYTEEKAAKMYSLVKSQLDVNKIEYRVLDFKTGLSALPDHSSFSQRVPSPILLLENTLAVPTELSEDLNYYIKKLSDHAPGPLLWHASIEQIGRLHGGYGSRAVGAFMYITRITEK